MASSEALVAGDMMCGRGGTDKGKIRERRGETRKVIVLHGWKGRRSTHTAHTHRVRTGSGVKRGNFHCSLNLL